MRCCVELQHCFEEKSYCGLFSCEAGRIRLAGAWVRSLGQRAVLFREHGGIRHGRKQKGCTALPQLLEKEREGKQE